MKEITIVLQIIFICSIVNAQPPIVERPQSAKYANPNFVMDRYKNETYKPQMEDDFSKRFKKPYNVAWMDYCDPYHCNDYHRIACGLNRHTMRFKWFNSICHLLLNNQCAVYRGFLKYDLVDNKYCTAYVMYLRDGCRECDDDDDEPVCAVNTNSTDVAVFKSRCHLQRRNCEIGDTEYEEVKMILCEFYLHHLVK